MSTSPTPTSPSIDDEIAKMEEVYRQQAERLERLKIEKLEKERLAKLKAEKLEQERLTREAERLERERIAKEVEKLRVEEERKAAEAQRLVDEETRRRIAKEKADALALHEELNRDGAKYRKLRKQKEREAILKKLKPKPPKRPEIESDYETEEMPREMTGAESDDENDGPPNKKKKARTDLEMKAAFLKYDFVGTTYPCSETTQALGIHGDFESLMLKCGLSKYMTIREPTYPEAAADFLATVRYFPLKGQPMLEEMGGGYIYYEIFGKSYSTTLKALASIFGFPYGNATPISIAKEETQRLWTFLTGGKTFQAGGKQNTRIRNPAISYARRAIAESFFSRTKTGPSSLTDMNVLTLGLHPYLGDNLIEGEVVNGDTASGSLAFALAAHLISYRWKMCMSLNRQAEPTPLCIGSPITAIMRHAQVVGIDWDAEVCEDYKPRLMDIEYLYAQCFLVGSKTSLHYYYRFYLESGEALIELPNLALTSIDEFENIPFTPPAEHLVDPTTIGASSGICSSERATATSSGVKRKAPPSAAKGKGKAVLTFTKDQEEELEERLTEKLEKKWLLDFEKRVADELEKLRPKLVADLTPLIKAQLKRDKSSKSDKSAKGDKQKKSSSKSGTFKRPIPPPGTSPMPSSSTMPSVTSTVAPARSSSARESPGTGSSASAQPSPKKKSSLLRVNIRSPGP